MELLRTASSTLRHSSPSLGTCSIMGEWGSRSLGTSALLGPAVSVLSGSGSALCECDQLIVKLWGAVIRHRGDKRLGLRSYGARRDRRL
ncbi:hypothetical protein AAFF_G00439260 [Aldrovandia affinis]|uniref:Uncharacterized protein n=1 Tax=Aldrovandia affinis TaxID=143900 RepID=A0AAD7WHQ0_9TELE|nr:hypothetical protein AAFF_G00439260 [Aldrovandia affinis]